MIDLIDIAIIWLFFGTASAVVASNRGASGCLWFGCGILFGPIGLALAFAEGAPCTQCAKRISTKAVVCPHCGTPQATGLGRAGFRKCPSCAEMVRTEALKCRFCGESLPAELCWKPATVATTVEQTPSKKGDYSMLFITAAVILALVLFKVYELSSSTSSTPKENVPAESPVEQKISGIGTVSHTETSMIDGKRRVEIRSKDGYTIKCYSNDTQVWENRAGARVHYEGTVKEQTTVLRTALLQPCSISRHQ